MSALAALPALGAVEAKKQIDFARLPPAASGAVDFAQDIQPIFAKNCFTCHGPEKQKNGLRLDIRQAALEGGDFGAVIVAGKSRESKLLHLVAKLDGETQMPPSGEGRKPLARDEIAKLRAWIDAGANWPEGAGVVAEKKSDHWAFNAPKRPAIPRSGDTLVADSKTGKTKGDKNVASPRNPIDAFVLARLQKEKIKPSPEADRYTLIRRLSFDLLGLPPKLEDVHEFIADKSPNAYEKLVDRLLKSPHFGERWGRHWLDLARYADSDGYEKDRARPFAYVYRDWVIKAINDDMPFDRFSILQLAGDLLPGAGRDEQTATGFHRQTLTNTEGGTDQEEFRCKATVDRVSTTAAVWLGVTMQCAECHTHKYDPFTQREFYQLFAFFNNASEKNLPAPQPDEARAYEVAKKKWNDENARLIKVRDDYVAAAGAKKFEEWQRSESLETTPWSVLAADKLWAEGGTTLMADKDGIVTASGESPDKETYTLEAGTELKTITGFRLEALPDPVVKTGKVGRAKDGNFVLTKFAASLVLPSGKEVPIELHNAQADFSQPRFDVSGTLDASGTTGWAVAKQTDRSHTAVFETKQPLTVPAGARIEVTLDHQYQQQYTLARFRVAATSAALPLHLGTLPDDVALAITKPATKRTTKEKALLKQHFLTRVDADGKKLQAAIEEHGKKAPKEPDTFAATLAEEPNGRVTKVHIRGNFLDRGAEVRPLTPAVLHTFEPRGAKPDRLDLAQWLFSPENPLTARVTVNHVWKNLFGRGLVASVDDFGVKGEKPTHPELLDWLAVTFASPSTFNSQNSQRGLGWSRKSLIKLIVTSATYKQSSNIRTDLVTRDPNNLLLARQNRLRLEAESVRDAYLAASGLLNEKIGGPSIRPPLPADIAALGYANSVKWTESTGTERNRRGLYIFFQRTVPYPMLMTFDAPDSNATCTRRERSNTPLQALTLLNDPVFFECAQALGQRMAEAPGTDATEKIRHGFVRCFARPPMPEEMAQLQKLYDAQLKLVSANAENAVKIAGAKKDDAKLAEKATLVALGRVMLNLDEFVTRD
ncbi:MAG: PSD1 domain-containing protein [Verrucomicrobia bacterium]|nr:PSD1 domain-containing protein [Verrucomicrobiota bacterium]